MNTGERKRREKEEGRERAKETEADATGENTTVLTWFSNNCRYQGRKLFSWGSQESIDFPFTSPNTMPVSTKLSACGFVMFKFLGGAWPCTGLGEESVSGISASGAK